MLAPLFHWTSQLYKRLQCRYMSLLLVRINFNMTLTLNLLCLFFSLNCFAINIVLCMLFFACYIIMYIIHISIFYFNYMYYIYFTSRMIGVFKLFHNQNDIVLCILYIALHCIVLYTYCLSRMTVNVF